MTPTSATSRNLLCAFPGRAARLGLVAGALAALAACDIDQSFLFPQPIEGVPGVADLGEFVPLNLDGLAPSQVLDNVLFHELGPTGSADLFGSSFSFQGVNGSVCIFVDPELIHWAQSVSPSEADPNYSFPDNIYDDGDLDLGGGLTVYYNGTPGEVLGDFEILYEDPLGERTPIQLADCVAESVLFETSPAFAGRGYPEFCELENTLTSENYTIVLRGWSLPIDDGRLSYGLLVTEGSCQDLFDSVGQNDGQGLDLECLVTGESLVPSETTGANAQADGRPSPSWYGSDNRPVWPGSVDVEERFCAGDETLLQYCRQERRALAEGGGACSWEEQPVSEGSGKQRCYCGDNFETPSGGAF